MSQGAVSHESHAVRSMSSAVALRLCSRRGEDATPPFGVDHAAVGETEAGNRKVDVASLELAISELANEAPRTSMGREAEAAEGGCQ